MSEQNLRDFLRRAVPEAPDLDAAAIERRAVRERRNRVSVAAGGAAVFAIAAGSIALAPLGPNSGGQVPPSRQPSTPASATQTPGECATAATDPEVVGESTSVMLVTSVATSAASLDAWLHGRASKGGPLRDLSSYTALGSLAETTPMTVCVFQVDPRSITVPSGGTTNANGVRVFVSSTGSFQIDAIGDVTRLSTQLNAGLAQTPRPGLTPTCDPFTGEVSQIGAGFIVELNIFSGNPNPAWRLSKAEGSELQRLLRTTRRGIDRDGPDEMGGFGVTADRGVSISFLRDLDIPDRFWVQGDNEIARFLSGTLPCPAPMPVKVTSHCGVVSVTVDGQLWLADPPLGDHNPPPGWDENETSGSWIVLGPNRAEFRGDQGQRASFLRADPGTPDPNAGCE